jgi:hypothetical protein
MQNVTLNDREEWRNNPPHYEFGATNDVTQQYYSQTHNYIGSVFVGRNVWWYLQGGGQ